MAKAQIILGEVGGFESMADKFAKAEYWTGSFSGRTNYTIPLDSTKEVDGIVINSYLDQNYKSGAFWDGVSDTYDSYDTTSSQKKSVISKSSSSVVLEWTFNSLSTYYVMALIFYK